MIYIIILFSLVFVVGVILYFYKANQGQSYDDNDVWLNKRSSYLTEFSEDEDLDITEATDDEDFLI